MVPLDGSALSAQGLEIAATIARSHGAELHVVTVLPPVSTLPTEAGPFLDDPKAALQAMRDGLQRHLEAQAAAIQRPDAPVAIRFAVLDGPVARTLEQYGRDHDIDLVVMTTHGWGGLKRFWLGSVAEALVHRAPWPVLLTRASRGAPGLGLHRIVIAVESDADANDLVEPALALGTMTEAAQYTLLQVVQVQPPLLLRVAGIPASAARKWARRAADEAAGSLEHVAQRLRHRGIAAESRVLVERGAAEQILGYARHAGCGLVVVGSSAGGLERAVFGSVSGKVARGATCPVLVVPLRVRAPETVRQA